MVSIVKEGRKYFIKGLLNSGTALVEIDLKDVEKIRGALRRTDGIEVKIKSGLKISSPHNHDDCVKFIFTGKKRGSSCEAISFMKKELKKIK
ncbi:hypothetical protein ACFLY1_00050 [Patescibacteria group bacterium]